MADYARGMLMGAARPDMAVVLAALHRRAGGRFTREVLVAAVVFSRIK